MSYKSYFKEIIGACRRYFSREKTIIFLKSSSYYLFILTATAQALLAQTLLPAQQGAAAAALGAAALAPAYVDMRTRYLPDALTFMLYLLSFAQAATQIFMPIGDALLGGAAGFAGLWGVNALFKAIRKKDGLGFGDVKLVGALGMWVGVPGLPYLLFFSSVIGLLGAAAYALYTRGSVQDRFAYGPALLLAAWGWVIWRASGHSLDFAFF